MVGKLFPIPSNFLKVNPKREDESEVSQTFPIKKIGVKISKLFLFQTLTKN